MGLEQECRIQDLILGLGFKHRYGSSTNRSVAKPLSLAAVVPEAT